MTPTSNDMPTDTTNETFTSPSKSSSIPTNKRPAPSSPPTSCSPAKRHINSQPPMRAWHLAKIATEIYLVRHKIWDYYPPEGPENPHDEIIGYYISLVDANRKARAVAFSQYKKVERYVDEDGLVSYMGLDIEDPDDNQPNLSVEKVILLPEGSEDEVEVGEGWEVSVEVEHEYGHGEDGTGTLG